MIPVEPALHANAHRVMFAEHQEEYLPLPASVDDDGLVMVEFEPTATELEQLLCGGRVRIWIHTFNELLQPISVEATDPECGMRES